ncbi:MAG: ferritin family protein [Elusimicrobiales bacterium]
MSASLAYAEALSAAVRVEENGALFYKKAAAGASDPAAAAVFAKLAEMEEEHRSYFSALKLELEQREALFLNDPKGEYAASIKALADSGVFGLAGDPAAFFEGARTTREAVKFAIGVEKDSIVFYLGLQEAMVDREEADKVGGIIKEELRHLAILTGLLKKIKE